MTRCKKYYRYPCKRKPSDSPSCSFEDEDYTTTATSMSTSSITTTITSEEPEEEPEIPFLPIEPIVMRDVYHGGRVFKYALLPKQGSIFKWQRCRARSPFNHVQICMAMYMKTEAALRAFHHCVKNTCGWTINMGPCRLLRTPPTPKHPDGRLCILEKFVPGLEKVNTNTGMLLLSKSTPAKVVNAFSHFSYAWSKGELLICNIRAHFDHEEKVITMVTPTINSKEGGVYGPTDLGPKGICSFFYHYTPNGFSCGYQTAPRKMLVKPQPNTMYVFG